MADSDTDDNPSRYLTYNQPGSPVDLEMAQTLQALARNTAVTSRTSSVEHFPDDDRSRRRSSLKSPTQSNDVPKPREPPIPVRRPSIPRSLSRTTTILPRSQSLNARAVSGQDLPTAATNQVKKQQTPVAIKQSSTGKYAGAAAVRPVIAPSRPRPREPPNVDHVLKSNSRINVTFDNKRYWDITMANRNLAERINSAKPTYSRVPADSTFYRSKLELKQSTGFFAMQRDNTVRFFQKKNLTSMKKMMEGKVFYVASCTLQRIAHKIMLAKPTVPLARGRANSANSRVSLSRPSKIPSSSNYFIKRASKTFQTFHRSKFLVPELEQGRSHGESEGAKFSCGFSYRDHFAPYGLPLFQLRRFALNVQCFFPRLVSQAHLGLERPSTSHRVHRRRPTRLSGKKIVRRGRTIYDAGKQNGISL